MEFNLRSSGGNMNGSEWLAAEGAIEPSSADEFQTYLDDRGLVGDFYEVCIHSPGGDLAGGMLLGELICSRGFSTRVARTVPDQFGNWTLDSGSCASAASFAFIGGRTRSAGAGEVGVHQFYSEFAVRNPHVKLFGAPEMSGQQLMNATIIEYVTRMGVDPRFVSRGAATIPEEMHFFTESELIEYRVRWQPKEFEPWQLVPEKDGLIGRTTTRDKTEWAEIFSTDGKLLTLRLHRELFNNTNWMKDALPVLEGLSVFKHAVPNDRLRYGAIGTDYVLDALLAGLNLSTVSSCTQHPVAAGDGPRYLLEAFWFELPTLMATTIMSLALKNPTRLVV